MIVLRSYVSTVYIIGINTVHLDVYYMQPGSDDAREGIIKSPVVAVHP